MCPENQFRVVATFALDVFQQKIISKDVILRSFSFFRGGRRRPLYPSCTLGSIVELEAATNKKNVVELTMLVSIKGGRREQERHIVEPSESKGSIQTSISIQ